MTPLMTLSGRVLAHESIVSVRMLESIDRNGRVKVHGTLERAAAAGARL
jgi:hypothetical protein